MSQTNCFRSLPRIVLIAGLLFTWLTGMHAQSPAVLSTVSPYSRFGLGDFQFSGGAINNGMGGGGIGYRNDSLLPQYVNLMNPASLTSHQVIAYEVSLLSNTVQLQNTSSKTIFNRTTIGNFSLVFPVTKWWGAGFGLVPYSTVGYNINTSATEPNIGPVTYKYEGSGGISQVFLTNSFRPFAGVTRSFLLSGKYDKLKEMNDTAAIRKKLRCRNNLANISVGINTSYLFGSLTNVRRDIFPDTALAFNGKITKRTLFRDVFLTYGVQYTFRTKKTINPLYASLPDSMVTDTKLFKNYFVYHNRTSLDTAKLFVRKPGVRITVGAIFSLPTEINVSTDLLAQTYKQTGTLEQFRDTIVYDNGIPGRVLIPAMAGVGISLKKDYKWLFQADYMTQMWSQMTVNGVNSGLSNSQRMTAGFQFQPKQVGRGGYMSVVQYRIGVRYFQTSLELNNTRLTEMSANLGFSLPAPFHTHVGEPVGRANVSLEYGFRGTTTNSLVREDFFRVTIGFTINDRWFSRYKYD